MKNLNPNLEKQKLLLIKTNLYNKYGYCNEKYQKIKINNILKNTKNKFVLFYEENLINNHFVEFLNRFYKIKETQDRFNILFKQYLTYLKFFCKPIFKERYYSKLLQYSNENKAIIYYQKNYQNTKNKNSSENSTIKENFGFLNKKDKIFGTNTKNEIDKSSFLPTIITNNMNYSNLFDSNYSLNCYLNEIQFVKQNQSLHKKNKLTVKKLLYLKDVKKIQKNNKISPENVNCFSLINEDKENLQTNNNIKKISLNKNNKPNGLFTLYKQLPNNNIKNMPIYINNNINIGYDTNIVNELKPHVSQLSKYKFHFQKTKPFKKQKSHTNVVSCEISINTVKNKKNSTKKEISVFNKNDSASFSNKNNTTTNEALSSVKLYSNKIKKKYSPSPLKSKEIYNSLSQKSIFNKKQNKNFSFFTHNINTLPYKLQTNSNLIKSQNLNNKEQCSFKTYKRIVNRYTKNSNMKKLNKIIQSNKVTIKSNKLNSCSESRRNQKSDLFANQSTEIYSSIIKPYYANKSKKFYLNSILKKENISSKKNICHNKKTHTNYITSLDNLSNAKANKSKKKVIILNKKFKNSNSLPNLSK